MFAKHSWEPLQKLCTLKSRFVLTQHISHETNEWSPLSSTTAYTSYTRVLVVIVYCILQSHSQVPLPGLGMRLCMTVNFLIAFAFLLRYGAHGTYLSSMNVS